MIQYISIVCLVVQNCSVVLLMHYSQMSSRYLASSAVVMQETVKLLCSIFMISREVKGDVTTTTTGKLKEKILYSPRDMLMIGVPGCLFVIQNNLLFVGTRHLSSPEYQVLYGLKILTTALLSCIILGKLLSWVQWLSLIILFAGAALAEVPYEIFGEKSSEADKILPEDDSPVFDKFKLIGIAAVVSAAFISGFAGVWTEKLLKDTRDSLWVRNAQLATFGITLGLTIGIFRDGEKIMERGYFQGFTYMTWCVIFDNAVGGLLVAVVLKYGDNILKCFGSAFSLLLTYMMDRVIDPGSSSSPYFIPGGTLVVASVALYSLFPKKLAPGESGYSGGLMGLAPSKIEKKEVKNKYDGVNQLDELESEHLSVASVRENPELTSRIGRDRRSQMGGSDGEPRRDSGVTPTRQSQTSQVSDPSLDDKLDEFIASRV